MGNKMKWEQDLVVDIRTLDKEYDNADTPQIEHPNDYQGLEFTECNRKSLLDQFMKIRNNCKSILEIGVCRNGQDSSTYIFLNNKLDETYYVGIDLDKKQFLNNIGKKIHTIISNSSNIEENIKIFKEIGVEDFDFIFIDGWHSINQVLIDWAYTKLLSPNGIVGFHDTSCHPGPYNFIRALNTEKWHVVPNLCPNDWGIGFAWLK